MKQNTILLILFGVILIYYLCKSSREGVEGAKYIKSQLKIDNNYQHYGCSQSLGKKPWYTTLEEAQKACDEIEECKFLHDGQDCDGKNYRLCTSSVSSVTHEGDKRACFWYPPKDPAEDAAAMKPADDPEVPAGAKAAAAQLPRHVSPRVRPHGPDRHRKSAAASGGGGSDGSTTRGSPANAAASARAAEAQLMERQEQPPMADVAAKTSKADLGPELLKKINELESTITKLKFQTKRARLQGQNIVAVDKLDMGKLSMDLFNWQKLNKKSNVDVNLILGDHIKNSAKETSVKHIISPNKKEKSCDPVADEKEQEPPVEYKGYPVFTKPEFPSTQKYELPKGAKAGPQMNIPTEKSDVNTGTPKPFNTASYDQKADAGIEKSH